MTLTQPKQKRLWRISAYGLICLSFLLRVYQLNNVAVDKGELMSITWFIRQGFVYLLTHNKDLNNHPLNSVLAYLTSGTNESIFTLRWHSVVIAVATVAMVLLVARRWFGRRDSLVAGLLIATSAYHVIFSQISRGYVGLIGFTLFGFYFVLRAAETRQQRYWLAFVIISVLNIYNHLYGVMAVGIIGLIAAGLLLNQPGSAPSFLKNAFATLWPLLGSIVAIYLLGLALYIPMWSDTISIVGQQNQFRDSDLRQASEFTAAQKLVQPFFEAIRPFSLVEDATRVRVADPDYHYTTFDKLVILAENKVGFYLALLSFLIGLILSWWRFRRQTLALAAWLAIPFIVQAIGGLILPGSYFRGRFLAFIYIPYLLLMARAWPGLADWLITRFNSFLFLKILVRSMGWLGVGLLVLLNLAWLSAYYTAARNEHWQEVADYIFPRLDLHDVVICGQRPKMACDSDLSTRLGQEVSEFSSLVTVENVQANRRYIEQPGRIWWMMPRLTAEQAARLPEKVPPTRYWLVGDPAYDQMGWILIDSQATLGDNLAVALQLASELAFNEEEKRRAYLSLTELYLGRDQLAEAENAFSLASALSPDEPLADSSLLTQLQYARQAASPVADLPKSAVELDLNFANTARLLAYEFDRPALSPGEAVQVTLYWQPLTNIEQDLISYVHIVDQNAQLVGQSTGIPGNGRTPTTTWQSGQLVVDRHLVMVEAGIPAPLIATIQAGLFDPASREFVNPIDKNARPVSSTLAKVKVAPLRWPVPNPAHTLNADFANLISLKGYDLVTEPPVVIFYWQALAPLNDDYTVFIHLLNAEGKLAAQIDGPPLQGNYPTSWWSPGEVIADRRPAPAIAPGSYRLLVGWYRLADGWRLPLADGSGDSVVLDQIKFP